MNVQKQFPHVRWPVIAIDAVALLLFFIGMNHMGGGADLAPASPSGPLIEGIAWQIAQLSQAPDTVSYLKKKLREENEEIEHERVHIRQLEATLKAQDHNLKEDVEEFSRREEENRRYMAQVAKELEERELLVQESGEQYAKIMEDEDNKIEYLEAKNTDLRSEVSAKRDAINRLKTELATLQGKALEEGHKAYVRKGGLHYVVGGAVQVRLGGEGRWYPAILSSAESQEVEWSSTMYEAVRLIDGRVIPQVSPDDIRPYSRHNEGDMVQCSRYDLDDEGKLTFFPCKIVRFHKWNDIPPEAKEGANTDVHGIYDVEVVDADGERGIMCLPAMNIAQTE